MIVFISRTQQSCYIVYVHILMRARVFVFLFIQNLSTIASQWMIVTMEYRSEHVTISVSSSI